MKFTKNEIDILRRKLEEGYRIVKRNLCPPTYYLIFHNFETNDTKNVVISREEFRDLTMSKEYSIKELLENELDPTRDIATYMIPNVMFTQSLFHSGTIKIVGQNFNKPQIKVDENKRTIVLYTQERVIVKKCHEGDKFDERIGIGLALSEWYSKNEDWKKMRDEMRCKKTHKLKYRDYALKVYDDYFGIRRDK